MEHYVVNQDKKKVFAVVSKLTKDETKTVAKYLELGYKLQEAKSVEELPKARLKKINMIEELESDSEALKKFNALCKEKGGWFKARAFYYDWKRK